MSVNGYIQLRKNGTGAYKFAKIPFGQFEESFPTSTTHRRTVTGALSSDIGNSYWRGEMFLRIPFVSQTINGLASVTIDDLVTWMSSKLASDRTLNFKHFDDSVVYTVRVVEPFKRQYATPIINNTDSYFLVPLILEQI